MGSAVEEVLGEPPGSKTIGGSPVGEWDPCVGWVLGGRRDASSAAMGRQFFLREWVVFRKKKPLRYSSSEGRASRWSKRHSEAFLLQPTEDMW